MTTYLPGPHPTRSRAVVHDGLVFAVSFVTDKSAGMYEQSRQALAHIDATLNEAGTDKSRILSAIVYIADMAQKPEMTGPGTPGLTAAIRRCAPASARRSRAQRWSRSW
jgi:enamine deaminase RidA (YjgF/YER057c/UK114 family)